MYITENSVHNDPVQRWALPDRVFFACGACHTLAYAFITRYADANAAAIWMKPKPGFRGNHIIAVFGETAFDYHGYSRWADLKRHFTKKAQRWWPGWEADYSPLPLNVLISESESKTYDGLWLREPNQFLYDALPRAEKFLTRFPEPPSAPRSGG